MINNCTLIGNLGRDPETKMFEGGSVTNFSVATTEKWKDKKGDWQEVTQWHEITIWNKYGELAAKNLSKGDRVYLEGKIVYDKYETREGEKRTSTKIVVDLFRSLSPKKESSTHEPHQTQPRQQEQQYEDDLPF